MKAIRKSLQIRGDSESFRLNRRSSRFSKFCKRICLCDFTTTCSKLFLSHRMPGDFTLDNLRESDIAALHLGSRDDEGIRAVVELLHTLGYDIDQQLVIAYNLSSFFDEFNFHGR